MQDDVNGGTSYLVFCVYLWHRQYFKPCRNHSTLLTGAIRNWAHFGRKNVPSLCNNVDEMQSTAAAAPSPAAEAAERRLCRLGCVWLYVSSFHTSAAVCFKMDVAIILVKSQKRIEWYRERNTPERERGRTKKREINMMLLSCYSLRWNWLFIKW